MVRRVASGMVQREGDDEAFLAHDGDLQLIVGLGEAQADDAEVEAAVFQFLDLAGGGQFREADFHVGVAAAEVAQDRGQPFVGKLRDEADGEAAGFAARGASGGAGGLVGGAQEAVGVFEEDLAGGGERDVVAVAVEEGRAEFFFELLDLHAERGLGDVQAFGGAAEAEFLGGSDEIAEVAEFHGRRITLDDNTKLSRREIQSLSVFTRMADVLLIQGRIL